MTVTRLDRNADPLEPRRATPAHDPQVLRQAFGAFPSGVVAVAAEVDGVATGLAASSFTSVSLDPPLLSVCVATTSSTWPILRRSPRLGLSVLADHHGEACRRLAGPAAHRFDGLATARTDGGAILLEDAVAAFECTVHREVDAGDHVLVLLELQAVHGPGERMPLVFHRSSFGRLAASA